MLRRIAFSVSAVSCQPLAISQLNTIFVFKNRLNKILKLTTIHLHVRRIIWIKKLELISY